MTISKTLFKGQKVSWPELSKAVERKFQLDSFSKSEIKNPTEYDSKLTSMLMWRGDITNTSTDLERFHELKKLGLEIVDYSKKLIADLKLSQTFFNKGKKLSISIIKLGYKIQTEFKKTGKFSESLRSKLESLRDKIDPLIDETKANVKAFEKSIERGKDLDSKLKEMVFSDLKDESIRKKAEKIKAIVKQLLDEIVEECNQIFKDISFKDRFSELKEIKKSIYAVLNAKPN